MEYSEARLKIKLAKDSVMTIKSKIFHQITKKCFPYAINFIISSKANIPVITYKIKCIKVKRKYYNRTAIK